MLPFDPRTKNRKYLTRDTEGQFCFTSGDNMDTFAHQQMDFSYNSSREGRIDQGTHRGRDNTSWRSFDRDETGVRCFDEPDDYYRDPRNPQ